MFNWFSCPLILLVSKVIVLLLIFIEFSAIELLFGYIKRSLKDIKYDSKEDLALAINQVAFGTSTKVL